MQVKSLLGLRGLEIIHCLVSPTVWPLIDFKSFGSGIMIVYERNTT
jgi:hypothetical protein